MYQEKEKKGKCEKKRGQPASRARRQSETRRAAAAYNRCEETTIPQRCRPGITRHVYGGFGLEGRSASGVRGRLPGRHQRVLLGEVHRHRPPPQSRPSASKSN